MPYGIERVCRVWRVPRSTVYDHRTAREEGRGLNKPGPKPKTDDDKLLDHIRQDLADSPFEGEGHRKVYHRLRRAGVGAGRDRVLRVMRENQLLSPHRAPKGEEQKHDGRITTDAPDVMWGTDGARVQTLEDGWAWIFITVDHFNSECLGWHVCKYGNRHAALQPVATGVQAIFGSVEKGVAQGLALRMDHGCQYTSDDFLKQLKFWGIEPSFAYVAQPETNGVAERFVRTLKEQAVYGRIFRNIEELRQAIADFVERYNNDWMLERHDYLSPRQARQAALDRAA